MEAARRPGQPGRFFGENPARLRAGTKKTAVAGAM
jgi:hypothetical protein